MITLNCFSFLIVASIVRGLHYSPAHFSPRLSSFYVSSSFQNEQNQVLLLPVDVKPTAHDLYTGRDPNRIKIFVRL